jgi:uncharacterized integral membrane protein
VFARSTEPSTSTGLIPRLADLVARFVVRPWFLIAIHKSEAEMKTITTIVLTVIAVVFSLQNFNRIPLHLLWGNPVEMQLTFVIAIAGITGYLIRYFIGIRREEELKRRYKALAARKTKSKLRLTEHDEEEL